MAAYQIGCGQCEYETNPMGVDAAAPRLRWVYTGENPEGLPVEIRLVLGTSCAADRDVLWEVPWHVSEETAVSYAGPRLESCRRYWWRAYTRLSGMPNTQAESEQYWFETGILEKTGWHGGWIRADSREESPVLIRDFSLNAAPKRAMAYVCGLGFFLLYVNGTQVGNEVLQPVWTAYSRQPRTNMLYPYDYRGKYRVPYRTFDIAPFLKKGENRIAVHLGNGWYHQERRRIEGDLWYGETPVLLFEGRINGMTLCSDKNWRWQGSDVVRNNIFFGEDVDFTRTPSRLCPVEDAPAPMGELCAQGCPSDAVMERYSVARALSGKQGRLILDFGQNMSGWVRALAHGLRGDRLELRFAEEIIRAEDSWSMQYDSTGSGQQGVDGRFQVQTDSFVLSGAAEERLEPRFCWHGFRYAEVSLLRGEKEIPLRWEEGAIRGEHFRATATALLIAANLPSAGEFSCGNDLLNWFHHATILSMRSNQHCGVPLDCPHRERLGYTGDGQITAPVVLLNLHAEAFVRKWMRDIFDAQNRTTGHIPHTAPFYNGGGGPGGWGGAAVFVPWALYRHTGDPAVLQEAWPHMVEWMRYLDEHSEDGIVVREEDGGWCLGDWCTPEKTQIEPALVNTAMTIKMLEHMEKIAGVLGKMSEAAAFRRDMTLRRAAFQRKFRQESGNRVQGADAFALWAGAVEDDERDAALQRILEDAAARNWHFDTGIFGTPILLEVLSDNGCVREAYRLMTAQGFPSFAHMRAQGATTLYEHWNGGSHNHVMFGAADAWLYAWVAGISQAEDSAGWRKIVYRPGQLPEVGSACAAVETPTGRCAISWRYEGNVLHVHTETPTLAHASMVLPGGDVRALSGGAQDFTILG